ncbi:NACHT domain- and WD repeat-containing protein 1 [Varanus komodoensis]|nr:NACHT domain- and WD repeat-containing protein 1 [Varanus komodoensis]
MANILGDLRVVIRFIGVTGESRNIRLMLQSLCHQIADIYNVSVNLSEDFEGLMEEFPSLLKFSTQDKPLLICLDGIDELTEEYDADLSWIPAQLPKDVYFIASMCKESDLPCSTKLKKMTEKVNLVQIPPLTLDEIKEIINSWLEEDHRCLSKHQYIGLMEACSACPLPLYVHCAYKESCLWTSFSPETEVCLPQNIPDMYSFILSRMEKSHGEQVVRRMASYVSLSRNGITQGELLDLMSMDDAVTQEVAKFEKASIPAFPLVLWLKLLDDLGEHLREQRTDSTYVFNWAHKSLKHVCMERYLKAQDSQVALHAFFADYYIGRISHGFRKCCEPSIFQPLAWILKRESQISYIFNFRKLFGTPYHLIRSKNITLLIKECLFNYEFLLNKSWASSVISVEEDLRAAICADRIPDLTLLSEALKLSKKVLMHDPSQMASQLIGRLHQIVAADKPVAPGDPKKYIYLPVLLSQCQKSSIPVFAPSTSCLIAPGGLLCNFLKEHIMRKAGLDESPVGIKIAGRNINNLRYSDDTTLIAESEEELKRLLMWVKEESAKVGLKLNVKKTKIMASGPLTSWQIDGEEMEVVTDFIFLGSKITADGDCSQEIKRCLLLGRKVMANLDSILKSRNITLPTKVCIVKAMVFPVAMYGCESWTIRKAELKRIEAFELWCWRRLLRVPWTTRRSNQSVLEEINPDCSLEGQILKMKLKYFDHLMRRKDSLEKSPMLGTIDGKRRRGWQRMRWLDGVTEAVGVSLGGLREMVEDKKAWRNVVYGVAMGHLDQITAIGETQQEFIIATVSRDGTFKLWDLRVGKVIFTLHILEQNISAIALCLENRLVAMSDRTTIKVWDLSLERVVYTAGEFFDTPILTSAMNGQLLLVFFNGNHKVQVFDLTCSCQLLHEVYLSTEEVPIHKKRSILVSRNSVKDYVLCAYRSGSEAMVFSGKKGKVVAKLKSQEPMVAAEDVAVTKEYFLVIFRCPFMRQHEIVHIELYNVHTFAYAHNLKGCGNDYIHTFAVNHSGSHLVAFSPIPNTNTTEIISWNLESEDHKHLAKFPSVPADGVCSDLRYCLAFCDGENYLRSWNLASKINDQSLTVTASKAKKVNGIQHIVTMENYPRYAVCQNTSPGVITVWNIMKSKCKHNAVRVERGLVTNMDIVLVRDMKLYILTDKGMASFADPPRPIFQTLLVYDLLKKKYIKKQTGLYIIPCPSDEYKILEGGLLLGLSENRDHFIIWNMETGFIKDRIRPEYKEKSCLQAAQSNHSFSKENINLYKGALSKEVTELWLPWERRTETMTGKKRRWEKVEKLNMEILQELANEKSNAIDQYLLSGDEKLSEATMFVLQLWSRGQQALLRVLRNVRDKIEWKGGQKTEKETQASQVSCPDGGVHTLPKNIQWVLNQIVVCSYYAHHLSVFSLETMSHLYTLESRESMLFLHNAALTYNGHYLVLSNYTEVEKVNYLTLWNLTTGKIRKRLKNEPNVCCTAITADASRIIFGVMMENRIKIWDPFMHRHRLIQGYDGLHLTVNSRLHILDGTQAVLLAGEVSLWNLERGTVISIFTPDSKISCMTISSDRRAALLGLSDSPTLVTLKMLSVNAAASSTGKDLFGEESSSSEEEPTII